MLSTSVTLHVAFFASFSVSALILTGIVRALFWLTMLGDWPTRQPHDDVLGKQGN